MNEMKFAPLYNITLIVRGECAKCTRVYMTHNRFCMIFNQLDFDIRTIIDSFFFYQTMPLRLMRNNIQHIYCFLSKKQKKYLLNYLKNIYYIFYKFEKKN